MVSSGRKKKKKKKNKKNMVSHDKDDERDRSMRSLIRHCVTSKRLWQWMGIYAGVCVACHGMIHYVYFAKLRSKVVNATINELLRQDCLSMKQKRRMKVELLKLLSKQYTSLKSTATFGNHFFSLFSACVSIAAWGWIYLIDKKYTVNDVHDFFNSKYKNDIKAAWKAFNVTTAYFVCDTILYILPFAYENLMVFHHCTWFAILYFVYKFRCGIASITYLMGTAEVSVFFMNLTLIARSITLQINLFVEICVNHCVKTLKLKEKGTIDLDQIESLIAKRLKLALIKKISIFLALLFALVYLYVRSYLIPVAAYNIIKKTTFENDEKEISPFAKKMGLVLVSTGTGFGVLWSFTVLKKLVKHIKLS